MASTAMDVDEPTTTTVKGGKKKKCIIGVFGEKSKHQSVDALGRKISPCELG